MRDFVESGNYASLASSRVDFSRCVRTKPEPIDFVLPAQAAGSFGICVSQGGVGKSMFWLQKAVSLTVGSDIFGFWSNGQQSFEMKRGPVVMVSAEDPTRVLENRIHAVGRHLTSEQQDCIDENLLLLSTQGLGFNVGGGLDDTWLAALERLVDTWGKTPRLMVFDTLNRCLGGANENSSTDMGAVVSTFETLCLKYGCATMALHHANRTAVRKDEVHSLLSSRGSSALTDNSRYVETMTASDENCITVAVAKSSYSGRPQSLCLRRDEDGVLWGAYPDLSNPSSVARPLAIEFHMYAEDEEDDWT